jgi:hypothetical protein
VYAGAAREAVFAVPAVIKRINADFVPLALRAPEVNNPAAVSDEDERWLYGRVNRAKMAPQGICVMDARGQVLTWVQMFDDDKSVLDFLEYGLKRFQDKDARQPAVTERYLKFPSARLQDVQDDAKIPAPVQGHAGGKHCAADDGKGKLPAGAVRARLVGRALDDKGKPLADVIKQEHYVEDQFGIGPDVQKALTKTLIGAERVRLPDDFSTLCASHAHLGHIDVKPCMCMIKGKAENKGEWKRHEFWARKLDGTKDVWQIDGQSEVISEVAINGNGVHNVKLAWEGFAEIKGDRLVRLILSARGTEKLQFAKDNHPLLKMKKDEVAFLPAGRPVDIECGVRYGIIGEASAAALQPGKKQAAPDQAGPIPDEARKELVQALGGPFIVFREMPLSGARSLTRPQLRIFK